MVKKGKVGVYVSIDERLNDRFREYLSRKYKKYEKGLLSHEISQAMNYWLALHTNTQKELLNKVPNPTPRVQTIYAECKKYLYDQHLILRGEFKSGDHVPITWMRRAIMTVRGSDKRTVYKWLNVFEEMKLTRLINSSVMEIM